MKSNWTRLGLAGIGGGLMLVMAAMIGGDQNSVWAGEPTGQATGQPTGQATGAPSETQGPAKTHTPTPAPTEEPTQPPATATSAPATTVPATNTPTGGAAGGGVQPPSTGTGFGLEEGTESATPLLFLAATLLIGGAGAVAIGMRRR